MSSETNTKLERIHLARAVIWPTSLPVILLLGWQNSVFLLLIISLYANFSGDIGAWQAARGERRNLEQT